METTIAAPRANLRAELRELYEDYAASLDDMEFDRWTEYFTDDARYEIMAVENHEQGLSHATMWCEGIGMIRDRAISIRQVSLFEPRQIRHFIDNVRVISATGDEIEARANFLLIESLQEREPRVLMVGRYFDRLRRTPQGLRFCARRCVYDNYRILNTLVIPV